MNEMIKVRMLYEKKGRAKYISHLDINRLMQRILKRAGLPIWYTEGFNPHMYLTFALPLSLGYESEFECMDFRLTEEMNFLELQQILNQNMPEGIVVKSVASPVHKAADIAAADYEMILSADESADKLMQQFSEFFSSDKIEVVKKTKRGDRTVDIKPDILLLSCKTEKDRVICNMRFPAGTEKNYNPSLLLDEFIARTEIELNSSVTRKHVYCKDGSTFA